MQLADALPVDALLARLAQARGTDLHLTAGAPPFARVDGELLPLDGEPPMTDDALDALAEGLLPPALRAELADRRQVDFAFDWRGQARFRGNAYRQRGSLAFAFRLIPNEIPGFDELGLPAVAVELVNLPQGLVLVTGPTGSGKSTTLASMIDWINTHRHCHVLTIEDPVEYLHAHRSSAVNQREIGTDADDFPSALRAALREDPDVLLVGEMRDPESIATALTIAETGHLVFATLHTNDSGQALDRIIDVFPAERRDQVQVQLASTLQAVVYQRLLPRAAGGLVAAYEILRANNAIRNLVREGKTRQLRNVVASSQSEGMQTLESDLTRLVDEGIVDLDTALGVSLYPKEVGHRGAPRPFVVAPAADAPTAVAAGRRGMRRR